MIPGQRFVTRSRSIISNRTSPGTNRPDTRKWVRSSSQVVDPMQRFDDAQIRLREDLSSEIVGQSALIERLWTAIGPLSTCTEGSGAFSTSSGPSPARRAMSMP